MITDDTTAEIKRERGSKYGSWRDNCADCRAVVKAATGLELSDQVITMVMIGMKLARRRHSKLVDHDVDAINYFKLLSEVTEYEG